MMTEFNFLAELSLQVIFINKNVFVSLETVDLDLSLNESEPNRTVTEEIVNVDSIPDLLSPGNIVHLIIQHLLFVLLKAQNVCFKCSLHTLHSLCVFSLYSGS